MPKQERDDKGTQDGINRLRDPVKLRSCFMKPPSFVQNVVCVSAQKSYRLIGISPPHRLFPARHPPREDDNIIAKLPPEMGQEFSWKRSRWARDPTIAMCGYEPFRTRSLRASSRSASTIMSTSSRNFTFGSQPSSRFAFEASPRSWSTSVGRR